MVNNFINLSITHNQDFFKDLFKNLDGYIEVREISEEQVKRKFFFKSIKELMAYQPPKDSNIYYGVYSRAKKQGTAESCKSVGALWADYDKMGLVETKLRIEKAGLPEPSILVDSGHGYHCYWLLKERTEKDVKPLLRAIAKKTGADMKVIDRARIMRVPGTYNVKDEPVICKVLKRTNKRYSLDSLSKLLKVELDKPQAKSVPFKAKNELDIEIDLDEIAKKAKRACIKSILQGVEEGYRNWAEGRIVKYLQLKGYTKEQTRKAIRVWNTRNKPAESEEKLLYDFEFYWRKDYKLLGCQINNPDLQELLKDFCNRSECFKTWDVGALEIKNNVRFNNRIFNDYKSLQGNELILYGVLLRHPEGLNTEELCEKLYSRARKKECMSEPTRLKALKKLKSMGLITVSNGAKRHGGKDFYKAKPQGTFNTGYTQVSNGAVNGVINGMVSPKEFKAYVLLLKYAYGEKDDSFPATTTLGNQLGIHRTTASMHIRHLEEADYLKRRYEYTSQGAKKLICELLV